MNANPNSKTAEPEITWNTDDLPMDRIVRMLGKDLVDWILAQPCPAAICSSRTMGAWYDNHREYHAAYGSLYRIVKG